MSSGRVDGVEYSATIWSNVDLDVCHGEDGSPERRCESRRRDVVLSVGSEDGRWRLCTHPYRGDAQTQEFDGINPPVVDLIDQTIGPDPLTRLRTLLDPAVR